MLRLDDIRVVELAEATPTPVERVLHRELSHEAPDLFDPGIVIIRKEEIDDRHVPVL